MKLFFKKLIVFFAGLSYHRLKYLLILSALLFLAIFIRWTIYLPAGHPKLSLVCFIVLIVTILTINALIMLRKEKQRLELIRNLIDAKTRAEESERFKMAFLANMSHEIRTPMNGILGFMELLKQPGLEDESRNEYIDLVNQSGERLLETINDIIELSKIESGDRLLRINLVDLEEIMVYFNQFFSNESYRKGIDLRIKSQLAGNSAKVLTDRYKLESILTNLIKNAIKYTEKGLVEIGNYTCNGQLIFYVRDTGPGIPQKELETVFERFTKASGNKMSPYESSGLGLSIAKCYADDLEGVITVESEVGAGSTFRLAIPYKPALITSESNLKHEIEMTCLKSQTINIHVAEDDDISYVYLEKLLLSEGYKTTRSTNGKQAVEYAMNADDRTIILMDIKMPLMDGLEAIREIRKFNLEIPIIAQTAFAMPEDQEKALRLGCSDYITKPVRRKDLMILIDKYSQKWQRRA